MIRKIGIVLAVLVLAAAGLAAAIVLAVPPAANAGPVRLLVPRVQVIGLMQHGYWCTRVQPGLFECTPAAP